MGHVLLDILDNKVKTKRGWGGQSGEGREGQVVT